MIRSIGRALARAKDPTKQAHKDRAPQGQGARDLYQPAAPPQANPIDIPLPSSFGVAPLKVVQVDMTELTLAADRLIAKKDYDKACAAYEALAQRHPSEPLPMAKLMVAYHVMGEHRALKLASDRLATVVPSAKARTLLFLSLFGDRGADDSSDKLLDLRLHRALALGKAQELNRGAVAQLLQDTRVRDMQLLCYAVARCETPDIHAVTQLMSRVDPASVCDQVATALSLAESATFMKLEVLLRANLVPVQGPQLDRLVDKAFTDGSSTLLQVLLDTCLRAGYARQVDGAWLNLAQVAMQAPCSDFMLKNKITVLARNNMLHLPMVGGESVPMMAIRRGGRAVAALLENGTDVEWTDPQTGNTLLIEAAAVGEVESVGVLLGHHANRLATNHAGINALDMARLRGFDAVEKQIKFHPKKRHLAALVTNLWASEAYSGGLNATRTDIFKLHGDQMAHLLHYGVPLCGFGALSDDFTDADAWTAQQMLDQKLPAAIFATREQTAWRYTVFVLVRWASELSLTQWQGLAELTEGLRDIRWVADALHALREDGAPPPEQWKAVANSVSGLAYRNLRPEVRCRVIRTAILLRRQFGSKASAALDWLNEIPVQGFDRKAYHSVMWDFVECADKNGDCAALAKFATEDATAKNKVGMRRTLTERLHRIDEFGQGLWHGGNKEIPSGDQAKASRNRNAALSQALTQTHEATLKTHPRPWTSHADTSCQPAIAQCMTYFGSATEMADIAESDAQQQLLDVLYVIFDKRVIWAFLRDGLAGSQIKRCLLAWHPDKVSPGRVEIASAMTSLLLLLRERLDDPVLRQLLVTYLDQSDDRAKWRAGHA